MAAQCLGGRSNIPRLAYVPGPRWIRSSPVRYRPLSVSRPLKHPCCDPPLCFAQQCKRGIEVPLLRFLSATYYLALFQHRSEEHTSELQSLMSISDAVF